MALSPLPADDSSTAGALESLFTPLPLKTYGFDFDGGTYLGVIDGRDALLQFIYKAVKTARYRFPIYGWDYGCELEDLIGQDVSQALLETEIPRVIKEALIYDDRIEGVGGFSITRDSDKLYISFSVVVDNETIPIEITA